MDGHVPSSELIRVQLKVIQKYLNEANTIIQTCGRMVNEYNLLQINNHPAEIDDVLVSNKRTE